MAQKNNNNATKHGGYSYLAATRHFVLSESPANMTPQMAAAQARVMDFVEEYGPAGAIALQAARLTVVSELLFTYMQTDREAFWKALKNWGVTGNAMIRAWRELREYQHAQGDDLSAALLAADGVLEGVATDAE